MPEMKPMAPAVTAKGPMFAPPIPGAYCQMRFDRTPVSRPGMGPARQPTRIVPMEST